MGCCFLFVSEGSPGYLQVQAKTEKDLVNLSYLGHVNTREQKAGKIMAEMS